MHHPNDTRDLSHRVRQGEQRKKCPLLEEEFSLSWSWESLVLTSLKSQYGDLEATSPLPTPT